MLNRRTSFCALGAILLLSPGLSAQSNNWADPFTPVQIADDFYYVGSAGLSSFLLTSPEGHVLIDATLEENVPMILANIRALGFDPADIRLLLATHAHFDHVAGSAAMIAATGAEFRVSAADAGFVSRGEDFGFSSEGYPAARPDGMVLDGEPITVGGVTLTPLVTPGHTPGCTSWRGSVTVEGVQRSWLLVCSLSLLGDYRLTGEDETWPGLAADFCSSLQLLERQSADIFLSNHGVFFDLAAKAARVAGGDTEAFVDPTGLPEFLVDARARIDRGRLGQGLPACATG